MSGDEFDDLWEQFRRLKGIENGIYRIFNGYDMAIAFAKEKHFTPFTQPEYMNHFAEALKSINMTPFNSLLNDVGSEEDRIIYRIKAFLTKEHGDDDE